MQKYIKKDLIELEMSSNDIILASETHLSQDIDNEDIQLRGFQKNYKCQNI
jgi:hypothetical protein